MAETFEEQVVEALRRYSPANGVLAPGVVRAVRANPAPVLALLSDDALRAACRERGIGLAEDEAAPVINRKEP